MPARFADAPADARKAVWHDRQFFFVSHNQNQVNTNLNSFDKTIIFAEKIII